MPEETEEIEVQDQEQEQAAPAEDAEAEVEPGDEAEQNLEESATSDGEPEEEQPKKKGGFQRKLDKEVRKRADAEREAEFWRKEALRTREAGTEKKPEVTASQPEPEPKLKDFNDWDEYMSAQRTWMLKEAERIAKTQFSDAEKRRQEQEANKQQEADQRRLQQEFNAREERASKKHKDWEEVAGTEDEPVVLVELQALHAQGLTGVAAIADVLGKADPDGDLEYYFATNPEEIKRIAQLPQVQASLELGKLLGTKLAPQGSATAKPNAAAVASSAPPPPKPIGRTTPTATGLSDDLSDDEWLKRRDEQVRRARAAARKG